MNRPIKYRAWIPFLKRMDEWNELAYVIEEHDACRGKDGNEPPHHHIAEMFENLEASGVVFLQYTGYHDKNGKEIYEGDIVKCEYEGHTIIAPFVFHRNRAQFGVDAEVSDEVMNAIGSENIELTTSQHGLPEILGNIFENPELLTKKP